MRRTRIKPFNSKRKARLRLEQFGETYSKEVCRFPCLVVRCYSKEIVPHHEPSVGSGGKKKDIVPLCWFHHLERHTMPLESFNSKHNLDLKEAAADIWKALRGD